VIYFFVSNVFMIINIVSYSNMIILLVYNLYHLMLLIILLLISISLSIIYPYFDVPSIIISIISLISLSIVYSISIMIHTSSTILYFVSLNEISTHSMLNMLCSMHAMIILMHTYSCQFLSMTLTSLTSYSTSINHLLSLEASKYELAEGLYLLLAYF
jgi:hypothetical protein